LIIDASVHRVHSPAVPTIHRIGVFVVRIYPNDHGPIHVHAIAHRFLAKVMLDGTFRTIHGTAPTGFGAVVAWVTANNAANVAAWGRTRPR
jgi:hypothetical protein